MIRQDCVSQLGRQTDADVSVRPFSPWGCRQEGAPLRRGMLLTRRVLVATLASAPAARRSTEHTCKVIDSAVHVWSDGEAPFPWEGAPPPEPLRSAATHEALAQLLRGAAGAAGAAGVAGALIVQPSVHKFDHSYVTAALRAHPELFCGMWRSSSSTRAP